MAYAGGNVREAVDVVRGNETLVLAEKALRKLQTSGFPWDVDKFSENNWCGSCKKLIV